MNQARPFLLHAIAAALFFLLAAAESTLAQDRSPLQHPMRSLGSLLNADGTLRLTTGFTGSLDARGWKMVTEASGQPRFIRQNFPAIPDDEKWDDRFAFSGLDGQVFAVAVSGTDVYVGGIFTFAGEVSVSRIARWDGKNWNDLGGGVSLDAGQAQVRAIAVSGTDVYVGGFFTSAGGTRASNIAKWDGNNWSALGDGREKMVLAIAVKGNNVYAGGIFPGAIARWDGFSWLPLGNNTVGGCKAPVCVPSVNAIAISGNNVYAAGDFTMIGGEGTGNVARWNGSSWSSVGGGVNCEFADCVNALAANGKDVYVGGAFSIRNGAVANAIAKWDGSSWTALGSGIDGRVSSITTSGNDVYASGSFSAAGETLAKNVARWDGAGWSTLADGISGSPLDQVRAIAVSGTDVYAGGSFDVASGAGVNRIAKYNGTRWVRLAPESNNGLNDGVTAIAVNGKDIYVGGYFTLAAGFNVRGIAKWDGAAWSDLGGGIDNYSILARSVISAIAIKGDEVYAGGNFYSIGGVKTQGIARWDGSKWSALGEGVQGCNGFECELRVNAITIAGNDVYVGGTFIKAGAVTANGIAKWDGANWSGFGGGISGDFYFGISSIAVSGTDVYAGGSFTEIGGAGIVSISRWDGAKWSRLGEGLECRAGRAGCRPAVYDLAITGGKLYVGGSFDIAGKTTVNNIATWDGRAWAALGSGADGSVSVIAVNGEDIYVGGSFTSINGVSANGVARWDGANWSRLGSGLNGPAAAIGFSGSDVYVGGQFSRAGGKASSNFGRWSGPAFRPSLPKIVGVSINGKKLIISGDKFDSGALILINGAPQKTANDKQNPTTVLIAKKSGKKIKAGDKLQVQNADGALSPEFTFTRSN